MNKLRFYLNKKLDEQMAEEFFNLQKGGIDFSKGILETHPLLKSAKLPNNIAQRNKINKAYFDNYYQIHRVAILNRVKQVQNAWRKQEQKYLATTEDLFNGFLFPQGKYIAYASIIDCNPRFLESKTFQFFYKKSLADAVYTITHELLHFIFYDFVKKKLPKEIRCLSEDQLWDLSEIFNVVILKLPQYRHIINQQFIIPYPKHKPYIYQFEKAYKNSKGVEEFIRRGITIINKKE